MPPRDMVLVLVSVVFGLAVTTQALPIPDTQPATSTNTVEATPKHASHWWDRPSVQIAAYPLALLDIFMFLALLTMPCKRSVRLSLPFLYS